MVFNYGQTATLPRERKSDEPHLPKLSPEHIDELLHALLFTMEECYADLTIFKNLYYQADAWEDCKDDEKMKIFFEKQTSRVPRLLLSL
ncbi:MAG: hypothetical protein WCO23_02650 [bacterium]